MMRPSMRGLHFTIQISLSTFPRSWNISAFHFGNGPFLSPWQVSEGSQVLCFRANIPWASKFWAVSDNILIKGAEHMALKWEPTTRKPSWPMGFFPVAWHLAPAIVYLFLGWKTKVDVLLLNKHWEKPTRRGGGGSLSCKVDVSN